MFLNGSTPGLVVLCTSVRSGRGGRHGRCPPRVRLLSSANNDYNSDYVAQTPDGNQIPACHVFVKRGNDVLHHWGAEALYVSGQGHPRHMDLLWPIWSYFDLTPEGRGDWMPGLDY